MNLVPTIIGRKATKKKEHDALEKTIADNVHKTIGDKKGIIAVVDSTHSGFVNGNNRNYDSASFAQNYSTFYSPLPKPFLRQHNDYEDAIGRIYSAAFVPGSFKMGDGQTATGLIKTGIFVPEGADAQKIEDGTHMSVSSSFKFASAKCSTCGFDYIMYRQKGYGFVPKKNADEGDDPTDPCRHVIGRIYNDKQCYLDCYVKEFLESSVVNSPADVLAYLMSFAKVNGDSVAMNDMSSYYDLDMDGTDRLSYISVPVGYGTGTVSVDRNSMERNQEEIEMDKEAIQAIQELKGIIGVLNTNVSENTKAMSDAVNTLKARDSVTPPASAPAPAVADKPLDKTAVTAIVQETLKPLSDSIGEIKTALGALKPADTTTPPAGDKKPEAAGEAAKDSVEALKQELAAKDAKIAEHEKTIGELKKTTTTTTDVKPGYPSRGGRSFATMGTR